MQNIFFTSFDGAKIYYQHTRGKSDKHIIFLHGLGGDLTAWKNERSYFQSLGYSTLAVDLRGHGLSSRSNKKSYYTLQNFARDIVNLTEHENIKSGIVVGHCFGGMVSMYLASLSEKFIHGLVLVDTSYKAPFIRNNFIEKLFLRHTFNIISKFLPTLNKKGHANFDKFIGTGNISMNRIISDILHTSLKTYLLICENFVDFDALTMLHKIVVPTLVIEGTNDSVFPLEIAKSLHKGIHASQLDLIDGANHILVISNPDELNESIHRFIQKLNY